ncbi:DUF6318 family protein [Sinomonas sp. G460-2]|uniref:DUF6318 family protein n=1 Tax=Sinomonas sp. G460-2 TaxID=3393464 RepID=UPI0039EFFDAE
MALYRSVRLAFRFAFRLVFRWPFRRASRSAGLVAVVVFGLGLAACGSGPGDAVPSGTSSSGPAVSSGSPSAPPTPDSRPTPASSRGPARNLPRPVLPEAAKQNTKEGFAAFTQYWFDTITYGLETGDSGPLREISLPDCKMCNSYTESVLKARKSDGWNSGPQWTISEFTTDMTSDPIGRRAALFFLDETASTEYAPDGRAIDQGKGGRAGGAQALYAIYSADGWKVAEAGGA